MKADLLEKYPGLLSALNYQGQPLGAYYSNSKPEKSTGPQGGFWVDIKSPADIVSLVSKAGRLMRDKQEKFRCMFQFLAQTRKKGLPAVFDHDNFGCPGCRFYLGFVPELPKFNHYFTSTGFPGLYRGERFAPSPASSERHAQMLEGIEPQGKYVIFEPLAQIPAEIEPEVVIFLCNAETIAGLVGLVRFVTDEADGVQSPFGSGCSSIFSWPLKYRQMGVEKAVLGVFDPAARPYLPLGEMTLSVPYPLFLKMVGSYQKSFLYADQVKSGLIKEAVPGWPEVRKKAGRMAGLLKEE